MVKANIATAKNQLSRLIDKVKQGETVLIMDRNRPVARLEPLMKQSVNIDDLHSQGILVASKTRLDTKKFLGMPQAKMSEGVNLRNAILEEREEGR